jgi:hypothetical protein
MQSSNQIPLCANGETEVQKRKGTSEVILPVTYLSAFPTPQGTGHPMTSWPPLLLQIWPHLSPNVGSSGILAEAAEPSCPFLLEKNGIFPGRMSWWQNQGQELSQESESLCKARLGLSIQLAPSGLGAMTERPWSSWEGAGRLVSWWMGSNWMSGMPGPIGTPHLPTELSKTTTESWGAEGS